MELARPVPRWGATLTGVFVLFDLLLFTATCVALAQEVARALAIKPPVETLLPDELLELYPVEVWLLVGLLAFWALMLVAEERRTVAQLSVFFGLNASFFLVTLVATWRRFPEAAATPLSHVFSVALALALSLLLA